MRLAPGVTFSWKRAIGLTALRQSIARAIGIPTTRQGIERKVGHAVLRLLTLGLWGRKRR